MEQITIKLIITNPKLNLEKNSTQLSFKKSLKFKNSEIIIFQPDFPVYWNVII